MKKVLITAIIVFSTIISQAQVSPQKSAHLLFKGVPIDGTLKEYVSMMEKNGFSIIETEDGAAKLKGDFASFKSCIVGVATQKQKDLVGIITVAFPACNTWSSLYSNYLSLKELLTEKYGKPSDIVEEFQISPQPADDNAKMLQANFDKCKYYTTYETVKGTIHLSIEPTNRLSCIVMLKYCDKINGISIRKTAINDL